MMDRSGVDGGRPFDWSLASGYYARYRDIYPPRFWQALLDAGLCGPGKEVLDLGTGTGVLPRAMYSCGARFTGVDSAPGQIREARLLAEEAGMEIPFFCCRAEEMPFAPASFDEITACQCFTYFDHGVLAPALHRLLRPGGRFAALYMAWLPAEDEIAAASERLILQYNPQWTGCNEMRRPIPVPEVYGAYFAPECSQVYDLPVPFTREGWHGRIMSCRGVGASLTGQALEQFGQEHRQLLERIAPERFQVAHYAALAVLRAI